MYQNYNSLKNAGGKVRRSSATYFLNLILLVMLMISASSVSQVSYTQTWETSGLNGWVGAGSGTAWVSTTTQICGTTNSIRTEQYYGTSANFTSPLLGTSNGGQVTMSFQYKVTNWSSGTSAVSAANVGTILVQYGATATGPWTTVETINSTNHVPSTSCATKEFTFSPAEGDLYVRFNVTSGTAVDSWYYIDDVVVAQGAAPTCFLPGSASASDIDVTSASFSWDASSSSPTGGYEWEVRTSGAGGSGATGLVDSGSTAAGVLEASSSLLTGATTYRVYVRANCGGGDYSAWSTSASFRTVTLLPVPWSEGFTTAAMPADWTNTNFGNVGSVRGVTGNPGNNIYKNLYEGAASSAGSFTTVNYGPIIAGQELSFEFKLSNYGGTYAFPGEGWGSFDVQLSTDNGANWVPLETVSIAVAGWNVKSYPLDDYIGSNVKLRISAVWSTGDYDLAFDNFAIQIPPTCLAPTGLVNSEITNTSVLVTWVESESGPANGYEYEVRTSGAAGSGATGLISTGTTAAGIVEAAISDLLTATTYKVHVRANCGGGDYSGWLDGASFKTATVIPVPWTEGFTTAAMPADWTNTNFGNVGAARGVMGNPGNNIYKNLYSSAVSGSFTTVNYGPIISGQVLSFDFKVANYGGTYAYPGDGWGSFTVEVSDDFGANWILLETVSTAIAGWNAKSFPLEDYIGSNLRLRISATWSTGDYDLAFDNFAIQTPPTCLAPTGVLNSEVTSTSATVSWTESESAPNGGYQYEVRTSGAAGSGATGLVSSGTVNGTTLDLSDLSPITAYSFYVRADCTSGDYSSWGSTSFTTKLANDICTDAIVVACGSSTPVSLVGATNENMAVCGISGVTTQSTPGVWYKIAGTGETMTVSTGSSLTNVDTRLGVYSGECGTLVCVGGNDDRVPTVDYRSEVMFPTAVGTDYYVLVYLYSTFTLIEPIVLTVACVPACTPATENDECADATEVIVGTPLATNNTCAATSLTGANPTCGNTFGSYFDTWYTFDSGTNTVLEVSTIATAPTVVGYAVYSGVCGQLVSVACSLTGAAANVTLTANTVYYVRAFSASAATRGDFTLNLKVPCVVPTALLVEDIVTSGATFNWTESTSSPANGYEFEVRTSGAAGSGATGLVDSGTVAAGVTTASTTALAGATSYTFYIRSSCGATDFSPWASRTFNTPCDAGAVPYTVDLAAATVPALPACIIVDNVNNDNKTWITVASGTATAGITGKVMGYPWHGTNAANDWFYLKGLQLATGVNYELKFKYKDRSFVEKLRVSMGDSPAVSAMTTELIDITTAGDGVAQSQTLPITVDADGVYYIGFQAHSAANMFDLYVGEISVDVALSTPGFDLSKLTYYPNPVQDVLVLNNVDAIDAVQVHNLLGQKVFEGKYTTSEVKIDMNRFAAGTYIVNVVSKGMVKNIKVLKK